MTLCGHFWQLLLRMSKTGISFESFRYSLTQSMTKKQTQLFLCAELFRGARCHSLHRHSHVKYNQLGMTTDNRQGQVLCIQDMHIMYNPYVVHIQGAQLFD